jgi:hypothetical protein
MDLHSQIKALAEKVESLKDKIETEESAKHAFVLPFFNMLGYDTYNPLETADQGIKKGEKVDYAIFLNEKPILIVECKHWNENLDVHDSQLFRYFHVTQTRFALLTNGIEYRFYTDLDKENKMDEKSFLDFDIRNVKETTVAEISKFHKSNFDEDTILSNASGLKYTKSLKSAINEELQNPSEDLVKLMAKKVYSGAMRKNVIEEFTGHFQRAFNQIINEKVNARLTAAITKEQEHQEQDAPKEVEDKKSKIETTEEEMEAFRIVTAILRRKLPVERIAHRDTQSYFGVLLDDNNRKPLCRFHFNGSTNYLGLFDEEKNEDRIALDRLEDIYKHEEHLIKTVSFYE